MRSSREVIGTRELQHEGTFAGIRGAVEVTSARMTTRRIEAAITSVSWIPSEAVEGMTKVPFSVGIAHYDAAPPDVLDDHAALVADDRCRFVNHLTAWIEVAEGQIVASGRGGAGLIGSTAMKVGARLTFGGVPFPDLHPEPEVGDGWVRFVQTAGGHTGVPAPRRVRRPPFVRIVAPTAWTTLALTLHADGRIEHELIGASAFPRHWVYDTDRALCAKSGVIDFDTWYRESHGETTPWGGEDSPAVVAAVESALERQLSAQIMRGGEKPTIRHVEAGEVLMAQGSEGTELVLVLDGVVVVAVDGEELAELGPGAVLGERAALEGGRRTSTVTARTPCRVATVAPAHIEPSVLAELSRDHRREEHR